MILFVDLCVNDVSGLTILKMATPRAKEFWKRYQVDEKEPRLGEGRYGSVRRALDTATGEIVAIKKTVMEVRHDDRCARASNRRRRDLATTIARPRR